jgi:dipeptidyl aminopeptidase/acylaminoacyl peptidase
MMAAMEPFSHTTSDGVELHGYITYPRTELRKKMPLVVVPHGGPWARDEWGFNPEVQFLANRGYAVLQVNFRGSTGYGRAFWEKGFKQWGQKMQSDITESVQSLIKSGTVDPKRVAIYGASYGGYATLAGLAFTPDLYACGIDYVGVSNLFTFMKTIPPYWAPYLEMMYEMVGDPEKDKVIFEKYSPVFHVDKIQAPLLIAQGAKDPRVNVNESNQMVEMMVKNGKQVEYILEAEEGHGFSNEETRMNFYKRMEKFLEHNMR